VVAVCPLLFSDELQESVLLQICVYAGVLASLEGTQCKSLGSKFQGGGAPYCRYQRGNFNLEISWHISIMRGVALLNIFFFFPPSISLGILSPTRQSNFMINFVTLSSNLNEIWSAFS
jgi:hypothetical protein